MAQLIEIVHLMPLDRAKAMLVDTADAKRAEATRARAELRQAALESFQYATIRRRAERLEDEAWAIQRVLRALQEANERIAELEGHK